MWLSSIVGCLLVINRISTTSTSEHLPQQSSPYQFGYTVRVEDTGDYKTHHEVNDGEEVRGVYSLGEPNGDLRVVNYTADKLNGFRAMVTVHPGASPTRARKQLTATDGNSGKQSKESLGTSPNVTKQNSSEEKLTFDPPQNKSTDLQDEVKNNSTTTNTVKIVNSSLFDILPGLDKHVPKIEYIVEEDYEDSDGIPVYLKNIDLDLSNRPQAIPVNVQEDPNDKSLELAETEYGAKVDVFTKVKGMNTSTKPVLQQSLKEEVSFSDTTTTYKETTNSKTNNTKNSDYNLQLKTSTSLPLPSEQAKTTSQVKDENQSAVTNEPNIKQTTENPVKEDFVSTLMNTVQNQNLQQHSTITKPDNVSTMENQIKDGILHQIVNELAGKNSGTTKTKETEFKTNNKIILATLMLPSLPIIKFTCMPDVREESGIKITPIMPHISPTSPNFPQYPMRYAPTSSLPVLPPSKNTIGTSTNQRYQLNDNRVYPVNGIHFTTHDSLYKFTSNTDSHLHSSKNPMTNIPYNPTTSGSSKIDLQKITLSVPTVEITPAPTKSYPSLESNNNPSHKSKNFIHNRHNPLYPIPYPWIYHPVRPSHSFHPRHLPVFVLPMSHNVNFARTFDPQSIDAHNN